MASREVYITTSDNPYSPRDQFDEWYAFDTQHGYNTCAYLARCAFTSSGISDKDNDLEVESAINDILKFNLTGNYQKLVYEDGKLLNTPSNEENNTPRGV